jgi:Cu(I)/Ag(I) efflux system membrane fusion protein
MVQDTSKKKTASVPVTAIVVTALLTLVVAGTGAYFLGYLHPAVPVGETAAVKQPDQEKKKVLYWRSSMNPTEVYDHPGKDQMGMELVPVYEEEEAAGPAGTIKINPVTIQNIGVKTVTVQRKRLSREIRTVGRIAYDEKRMRQISFKVGGWVEHQYADFVGQEVQKGEPLLEIYSPDLVSTQEEYLLALRNRNLLQGSSDRAIAKGAEDLLQSSETRLRYWDISDAQIKALREQGTITRNMILHAPFRGIITERKVLEGGYVQPGQSVYHIADISTVWVYAEIYEYEAPWLKAGQKATMTLSYEPGATYHGRTTFIYPYVKNMTRTIQVRMEFSNSEDYKLKPDMWAKVTLYAAVARDGLAVPIQSVIRTGIKDIALVALPGGRFEPREVHLGPQAGGEFQVLSGLEEGEKVVTSAQFLINSESNLQAALSKMTGSMGSEATSGKAPMPSMKMPATPPGSQKMGPAQAPAPMQMPGKTTGAPEEEGPSPKTAPMKMPEMAPGKSMPGMDHSMDEE